MSEHVLTDEEAAAYLSLGITPREVIRLRWPNVSDQEADYLLWEETAYPMVNGLHDIADAVAAMPKRVVSIMDASPRRRRHLDTIAGVRAAVENARRAAATVPATQEPEAAVDAEVEAGDD